MAPGGETRRRLVSTTAGLLRRQGLHGTGLQEVLAESAAPRGSLYFHFPGGKEQLVEEALDLAAESVFRWQQRCLDGTPTAAEAVARMLDEYAAWLERSAFSEGCPVAGVALDLGAAPSPLHAACRRALERWTGPLADRLRAEGRMPDEAEALATTAIAAFEGALLMSRARGDAGPLRQACAPLRALLAPPAVAAPPPR